ncbi:unnamed protein product [Rhizoctonia solani]|uniref:Vegetative incompatibility protein HET-E-1 n=1 Tax=Rhizoctonia solani TaxID=456999 RepID=A0A8H2XAP3_9AGAM|nr:unnamed protein product [Rhizoctonia solani]
MSSPLSDEQLTLLVEQCDTLFIYAVTLVRYIKPGDESVPSEDRLDSVLRLGSNADIDTKIDELYSLVLNNALQGDLNIEEKEKVRSMLHTVLCAKEPASIKTIAALCGLKNDDRSMRTLSFTLKRLRSVIYLSETGDTVSVFHTSFPDFMFDSSRAGDIYCDRDNHNRLMARQCFGLMRELRFNICELDSSYITDKDAITPSRIDKAIQPTLWYACRYWAEHLAQTMDDNLCSELKSFLSTRLLFWMEALNLKGGIAVGGDALLRAGLWLTERSPDADLIAFVEDAKDFLASFAASPVSISTPHIYTSLLPFCPRSSAIFKCYRDCFRDLVEPDERTVRVREVAPLASWKYKAKILSVAYSHDGLSIAFGCRDGTVGVHMSYDNTRTFGDEENPGHDKPVWSVAFSPNKDKAGGRVYLASGSDDGTIRIWNLDGTERSICRLSLLPDTTDPGQIKSIAFSPKCNGTIASGSSDRIVCIWDSLNGKLLLDPLHGHTGEIWSVAFSPDGDLVASGSDDGTIRLWNSKNGQPVLTLTDQGGQINSISFSPDGTRMASGSSNKTVCVWDPKHGEVVAGPFAAHSYKVSCVKFSSDGKYLASSSHDRTIRVWDPLDGKPIAGPFEGHTGLVYSIAFSPDDTRIISGSPDGTIRLWDPRRGVLSDDIVESHTEAVSSVAFSPDGQHVASCSYDGTVRMWDVRDNVPIAGGTPIGSHDRKMTSLAFSSDGEWVVTGSLDHKARVWDIRRPGTAPVIFEEHSGPIWSVTFSHHRSNSFVASGGGKGDNSIHLWDPSKGTSILPPLTGHTDEVLSIAISPDNLHLASASRDKTLRVWDLKNNTELRVLDRHTRAVWSVAYSHDGYKFASSSSDGIIFVWDSQKTEVIATLVHDNVPDKWISSVAFSPDDNFIASSANHTIRLWNLSTGDLVGGPYEGHCELVWSVAFSPSGTHIVSGSHDGTIRFWDIKDAATIASGQSAGTNAIADEWELDLDGWIKQGSDLLLWVPHEVARSLLTPHCSSVITSSGPLRVDFNRKLKLGTSWKDCHIPQSNKHTSV